MSEKPKLHNRTPPNAGKGRRLGSKNKSTARAQTAIALFVEGNTERLQGWLDAIADKDPKAAFQCVVDLIEFHVPKLARTEHVGDADQPVATIVKHIYEDAN